MQHHRVGQTIHRIVRGFAERGAIGVSGNAGGLVPDALLRTVVLVGVDGRNIKSTVTEGAVGDGAMADVGLVGEFDFENCDVANDGGGDGCDEEKDRSDQEKDDADPNELLMKGLAPCRVLATIPVCG